MYIFIYYIKIGMKWKTKCLYFNSKYQTFSNYPNESLFTKSIHVNRDITLIELVFYKYFNFYKSNKAFNQYR